MGAARSLTEWAAQVPESSIVTTMARNGTTFGIRLAGSGQWFLAEAPEVGHALYYAGQGPQTSAKDIGDSAVLELSGLGAAARPVTGSGPAAGRADARGCRPYPAACRGVLGTVDQVQDPGAGQLGTPLGVDVRKVVELASPPAVTTGILHRSAGTGQVGAGVAEAPLECFADAMADLDRRLTSSRA